MVLGWNAHISKTLSDYNCYMSQFIETALYIVDKLSPYLKHLVPQMFRGALRMLKCRVGKIALCKYLFAEIHRKYRLLEILTTTSLSSNFEEVGGKELQK